jgi:hypothetical protein
MPTSSSTLSTSTPFLVTSSPPDPTTLHITNQAFIAKLSSTKVATPIRNHMRQLSGISERLQAQNTILQKVIRELKQVNEQRKERQSGKET